MKKNTETSNKDVAGADSSVSAAAAAASMRQQNKTSTTTAQQQTAQQRTKHGETLPQKSGGTLQVTRGVRSTSQSQNQSQNATKYLSNSDPIEVSPSEIYFKDIQINQTYEITVYVRNLTKTARRIRVFQPQTPAFRADYEMQGGIAAGLAMRITVTFETTYLDNFKDMMKIVSDDDFEKEINLYAYKPSAQIIFEPFINLGFVRVAQLKKEKIYFKNEGKVAAKVDLKSSDPADLKVEPPFFTVQPDKEFAVTAIYESQEAGLFRGFISVQTEAQCLQKMIDINATAVEYSKFLIDSSGNQSTQFDFGTFYYGEHRKLSGFLVNNTPNKYKFKVAFRLGLIYTAEDIASLQTPNEVGREQTEKIMSIEPSEGIVDSYSQLGLTFKCHSKVHPKHEFWAQSYAISKEEMNPELEEFSYSAIISYEGDKENPTIIHVTGRGLCPTVKVSHSVVQYGDCSVNEHKDCQLSFENRNPEIPIRIAATKIPYFTMTPNTTVIQPKAKETLISTFQPKAIGSFQKNMQILLMNGAYKLDIKMLGKALEMGDKTFKKRGPEMLPENFDLEPKFMNEENLFQPKTKKQYEDRIKETPEWVLKNGTEKVMEQYQNSKKYDDLLRDHRSERLQKEQDRIIAHKYNQMSKKLEQLGLSKDSHMEPQIESANQDSDNEEAQGKTAGGAALNAKLLDAPIDFAYEVGMVPNPLEIAPLPLPIANEPLFVNKPIGKYEPYSAETLLKGFVADSNSIIKKKWHSQPQNHKEIREIGMKLGGDQLQKIFAGPVFIDFGPVYVKSTMRKSFTVRNDLRTAISCRLIVDCDELKGSYQTVQIIPPSQVAGFDVILMSHTLGQFKSNVKYVINEQHGFEFQAIADIQLVKLELSRTMIKMNFLEDNHEMVCKETIKLTNNGNAAGKFEWAHTPMKIFSITPDKGEVPPNSSLTFQVVYKPSQQVGNFPASSAGGSGAGSGTGGGEGGKDEKSSMAPITRVEEEKIILKVQDGIEGIVKCSGTILEARCLIKTANIDMKEVAVAKAEIKTFAIKNQSRIQAIYSIDESQLPECVTVSPMKGRIGPDDQREILVTLLCSEEKVIKGDIVVLIRGGRVLKVPFYAKTIIPQVSIVEEEFDFGNITTLGNHGELRLTLKNESNIPADLVLDMRTDEDVENAQPGIECLIADIDGEDDDSVLHSVHDEDEDENDEEEAAAAAEKANQFKHDDMGDDLNGGDFDGPGNETDESIELENTKKTAKLFNLTIYPNQTLNFVLKFCPKEPRIYHLVFPLTLAGYGPIPSLEREITCKGLSPKFLVEPQSCEFKRKVITTPDKCFPDKMQITLSNPDSNAVKWRIDTSGLSTDKLFQVEPSSGIVQAMGQVLIDAYFNPYAPGNYNQVLPLYIEDDPEIASDVPYVEIQLKGEAAFPRLQFDRKEIIMPVVPLNVESRCIFRIINDGYENMNLKYKIIQDIANINVKLNWLDGKNLGITKHRVRVEAVFSNKKPLSFTTRIEFSDESDRIYPIHISGTTDNCLFTSSPYLQRCKGEYQIKLGEVKDEAGRLSNAGNLIIEEDEDDINSVDGNTLTNKTQSVAPTKRPKGGAASTVSYGSSKSSKSLLGYQPVPTASLDSTVEYIVRWLNYHVLSTPIESFPQSAVETYGAPIFDLITFLTGRTNFAYRATIDHLTKRAERSKLLLNQYDELIRQLKIEGAMLNHIRPEYLLSYADYISFVKNLPESVASSMSASVVRLPSNRFMYLSIDAWVALFYQIIKIYYLNRLNTRNFKAIPGIPAEKMSIPGYIDGSNLITVAESLVLYWMEINYERHVPQIQKAKRLCNFDADLRDGSFIQALVLSFIGKSGYGHFANMRMDCSNETDYSHNGERVTEALKEIGINTHLAPQDFAKSSMRELLLFALQMLYALPHYIPKGNPIIFSCVLGEEVVKNIELYNPTSRTICYSVKMEGSSDFAMDSEDQFLIEPKDTYKFRVKFTSRLSEAVNARIYFTNKKESNVQAAALVFDLKSNVTGRVSEKIIQATSNLYENTEFAVQVTNKFTAAEWGEFEVSIIHIRPEKVEVKKKSTKGVPQAAATPQGSTQKGNKKTNNNATQKADEIDSRLQKIEQQSNEIFPSFFCRQVNTQRMRIKRGATANLNVIFLPLVLEAQRCFIVFKDPNLGEFQYEVLGNVELPTFGLDLIRLPLNGAPIYVDEVRNMDIPITFYSEQLNKARKLAEQLIMERKERVPKGEKQVQRADKLAFPGGVSESTLFTVEMTPSVGFITVPSTFTIVNPYKNMSAAAAAAASAGVAQQQKENNLDTKRTKDEQQLSENYRRGSISATGSIQDTLNRLPVSVAFKNAVKDFKLSLTLRNATNTDIRRFRVEVSVNPKPVRASLEFRVPARQSTMQEIPIVNNTERDWVIKVNFVKDKLPNSHLFSFPPSFNKEFLVRRKTTGNFPLTFKPKWICEAECKLSLSNPLTNDLFEYSVKGFGEEPLAEEHIILQCHARSTKTHEITIKNPFTDKEAVYTVETDLLNASGAETIHIKPGQKATYVLKVTPILSGQYTGSITFTEADGSYLWYTVVLTTASPAADRVLELASFIRQACSFQIEISNPLDQALTFDVVINGDCLIGESLLQLDAKETKQYELVYSPLYVGRAKGSIAFVNELLGEKWYELNLSSEDQPVVKMSMLKTELGKFSQHKVMLENPTGKEIKAISKCSNPLNFEILPADIILKPFSSTPVFIRHSPSSLDQTETADVQIITGEIGKWRYTVYGMGIPPTISEKKEISVGIHKDFSTTIAFKNPFKEQIQVQVYMVAQNKNKDVFKLMMKGKKVPGKDEGEERVLVPVEGMQTILIPLSFIPREITKYYCEIVVTMNEKIEWRYPIEGVTSSIQPMVIQTFKCQCRQKLEEDFSVHLPGISSINGSDDTFSYEIECPDEELQALVNKALTIKTTKNYLADASDRLEFQVKFQPTKPFKASLLFHIHRKAGGKWRYYIEVEATEPDPDDSIVICSNLHRSTSVSFKLTNKAKQMADFTANFTAESDPEFTVFPKNGKLESYGRDGTNFIISFTPIEYGKIRNAKLVIQTEDMYWSYMIKGKLPKYNPPQAEQSLINDKLEAEYDLRMCSTIAKNHMVDNIKKAKLAAASNASKKSFSRSINNNSMANDSTNLASRSIVGTINMSSSISYIAKAPPAHQ